MTEPTTSAVSVELAVLTIHQGALSILVIDRDAEHWRGRWALPSRRPKPGEELDAVAAAGINAFPLYLEQLHTYAAPATDRRGRQATVAYLAVVPGPHRCGLDLGGDVRAFAWTPVEAILAGDRHLAFDHDRIVADAVDRVRSELERTALAAAFAGPEFTISILRRVYETIWGTPLDQRNFNRKITTAGFLIPTGQQAFTTHGGRPAALYRCDPRATIDPPISRPRPNALNNETNAVAAG